MMTCNFDARGKTSDFDEFNYFSSAASSSTGRIAPTEKRAEIPLSSPQNSEPSYSPLEEPDPPKMVAKNPEMRKNRVFLLLNSMNDF